VLSQLSEDTDCFQRKRVLQLVEFSHAISLEPWS
jgi:hypothetical protein